MRVKNAWKRWQQDREPVAATVLERRYGYLGSDLAEDLAAFSGRPGQFPAFFARRRSLAPPDSSVSPRAVAVLDRSLTPRFPPQPRLYSPEAVAPPSLASTLETIAAPERRQPAEPLGPALEPLHAPAALTPTRTPPPDRHDRAALVERREAPGGPASRPILGSSPVATARPVRPLAPRQVAAVETLDYFRQALSAVHRIVRPNGGRPEVDNILLEVGNGRVVIAGRDWSRCHLAAIPARTEGQAAVAIPRDAVAMNVWGQPGRLAVYEEWISYTPERGEPAWTAAVPAVLPALDSAPGAAGVLAHRDDLTAAVREAVGGCVDARSLPAEVRLVRDDADHLVVVAQQRGTVRLRVAYAAGDLDVRLNPRWLLDALGCCPAEEVALEALGRFAPVRVESGWLTCILATRTEEPFL